MPVQRAPGSTSVLDVLDRVLDKGIVIDAWMRVSVMGIDLITVEARVVVASIETYQHQIGEVRLRALASTPAVLDGNGRKSPPQKCARCNRTLGDVDRVMFMQGDLFHDQCWRELRVPRHSQLDLGSRERVPA